MKAEYVVRSFVENAGSDYSTAFKLLGFLIFLADEGPDAFLAGQVLSPRTYHRWLMTVRDAGLEGLALDARLRQLVREYVASRFDGLPVDRARPKIMETISDMIGEGEARSLQAISRQASAGVKGERSEVEGPEAKPRALDAGADGGSLRTATALNPGGRA